MNIESIPIVLHDMNADVHVSLVPVVDSTQREIPARQAKVAKHTVLIESTHLKIGKRHQMFLFLQLKKILLKELIESRSRLNKGGSGQQINRLRLHPKSGGFSRLRNTDATCATPWDEHLVPGVGC